jgi:hypothetical protein
MGSHEDTKIERQAAARRNIFVSLCETPLSSGFAGSVRRAKQKVNP